jgi:glycosyltransferase involved in cell wall biosynthesis
MNKQPNIIFGFRHLKDVNALKTFGLDGPLVDGQDQDVQTVAIAIETLLKEHHFLSVKILYSKSLVRLKESAHLVAQELSSMGIETTLQEEPTLRFFDQGTPNLPEEYTDGEHLQALEDAWDVYCDETYTLHKNIGYSFGDPRGAEKMHDRLANKFSRYGESASVFMCRQYAFLDKLISQSFQDSRDQLVVFCGQSATLFLLLDLLAIARDKNNSMIDIVPEELHFLCWKYYKNEIENKYKEKHGQWFSFDLNKLEYFQSRGILRTAREFLSERNTVLENSVQEYIQKHSNDYTSLSGQLYEKTERELDALEPLPETIPFSPISVVIPYFHSKSTIFDVLHSIELQELSSEDMKKVEVIVVDDGSNDGLAEALYSNEYRFTLRVITCRENGGRSKARNVGAHVATHEILLFVDADNILSGECLREHVVRNVIVPDQLYTSLVANIYPEDVETILRPYFENNQSIPKPQYCNEYRVYEEIKPTMCGLSTLSDTVHVEILKNTNNFRTYGFGRRIAHYDLASMFATYVVSVTKKLFEEIGGFSEAFEGWGMEDAYFGAVGITKGAKIIPILSCASYSINLPSHSGSEEQEKKELQANLERYKKLISTAVM